MIKSYEFDKSYLNLTRITNFTTEIDRFDLILCFPLTKLVWLKSKKKIIIKIFEVSTFREVEKMTDVYTKNFFSKDRIWLLHGNRRNMNFAYKIMKDRVVFKNS